MMRAIVWVLPLLPILSFAADSPDPVAAPTTAAARARLLPAASSPATLRT